MAGESEHQLNTSAYSANNIRIILKSLGHSYGKYQWQMIKNKIVEHNLSSIFDW